MSKIVRQKGLMFRPFRVYPLIKEPVLTYKKHKQNAPSSNHAATRVEGDGAPRLSDVAGALWATARSGRGSRERRACGSDRIWP